MTELIVRELRLRTFEGLARARSRGERVCEGDVADVGPTAQESTESRLATRYSRRRWEHPDLEL